MKYQDQQYYGRCHRADLSGDLKQLALSPELKLAVKNRFILKHDLGSLRCQNAFVKELIYIYRSYYQDVLLQPRRLKSWDKILTKKLQQLALKHDLKVERDLDAQHAIFETHLKGEGFYALFGRVSPFYNLMIWKEESEKNYQIQLPLKKTKVKVIFLKRFLELGWMHFATFGKNYVGGWAKSDALYCVRRAYRPASADFWSHYLAHEAQHFCDYKEFKNMPAKDLEYRAKLTELALTKRPRKFLQKLELEASRDKSKPHSYAAYRVLADLNEERSSGQVKSVVSSLLREHGKSYLKSGKTI